MLKVFRSRAGTEDGSVAVEMLILLPAVLGILLAIFWAGSYMSSRFNQVVAAERAAFAGVEGGNLYTEEVSQWDSYDSQFDYGNCGLSLSQPAAAGSGTTPTTRPLLGFRVDSDCTTGAPGGMIGRLVPNALVASDLPDWSASEPWHSHSNCAAPGEADCPTVSTTSSTTTTPSTTTTTTAAATPPPLPPTTPPVTVPPGAATVWQVVISPRHHLDPDGKVITSNDPPGARAAFRMSADNNTFTYNSRTYTINKLVVFKKGLRVESTPDLDDHDLPAETLFRFWPISDPSAVQSVRINEGQAKPDGHAWDIVWPRIRHPIDVHRDVVWYVDMTVPGEEDPAEEDGEDEESPAS